MDPGKKAEQEQRDAAVHAAHVRSLGAMSRALGAANVKSVSTLGAVDKKVQEMYRTWLKDCMDNRKPYQCMHRPMKQEQAHWAPWAPVLRCNACFFILNIMTSGSTEDNTCDICRKVVNLQREDWRNSQLIVDMGPGLAVVTIYYGVCKRCLGPDDYPFEGKR